jgi:hypothetical protein
MMMVMRALLFFTAARRWCSAADTCCSRQWRQFVGALSKKIRINTINQCWGAGGFLYGSRLSKILAQASAPTIFPIYLRKNSNFFLKSRI